jgi:hypothetical protein
MAKSHPRWIFHGLSRADRFLDISLTRLQGGGVAAAFTAQFPYLVEDKVVLISCAGLVEASDLSRTAKFMSSPLVLTLASGGPVRVSNPLLSKSSLTQILISQTYFQRLTNTSSPPSGSSSPVVDAIPDKMNSPLMEVRYLHSLLLAPDLIALLFADRPPTISTPHRIQCCNIFLAQGRPCTWSSSLVFFKWICSRPECTFTSCTSTSPPQFLSPAPSYSPFHRISIETDYHDCFSYRAQMTTPFTSDTHLSYSHSFQPGHAHVRN